MATSWMATTRRTAASLASEMRARALVLLRNRTFSGGAAFARRSPMFHCYYNSP